MPAVAVNDGGDVRPRAVNGEMKSKAMCVVLRAPSGQDERFDSSDRGHLQEASPDSVSSIATGISSVVATQARDRYPGVTQTTLASSASRT
jgi:hypothetical protein